MKNCSAMQNTVFIVPPMCNALMHSVTLR
uniref:Uncharacterized protein n=1 Tax=Anguilla anguilla TaxID=7936 RepID=A0A0E9P624_ANGAN